MSFHTSAQDVRVDDGHMLRARLENGDGDWNDAEIDLNEIIGNSDGNFTWGGQAFAYSADDIRFDVEGDAQILRASLRNINGDGQECEINLSERIGNSDGQFYFVQ